MSDNKVLQFKDPHLPPDDEMLEQTLGSSYAAYEALQEDLPGLDMEQEWQWYKPYKAWFAKGQHFWTTPKGAKKEKTLYWLYVFTGYFTVAVWFKEKNRAEVLNAPVSPEARELIANAETKGKLPTFPVEFNITTAKQLADVYILLDCKKKLEK